MKIIADTHTHTIYSGDAFSTIIENLQAAKKKGLTHLCMTDHAHSVPRAAAPAYFTKLFLVPREYEGVLVLRGVEANIIDYDGTLDMPVSILDGLDWVIASLHTEVIQPLTKSEHTRCWAAIAENASVDVIGHCGDPRYSFEIDPIIRLFKEHGKVVEINNHSFHSRKGAAEVCREIAATCMRYEVPVVVSSDAHFAGCVGDFDDAVKMLEEINFPEELILNANSERFSAFLEAKRT